MPASPCRERKAHYGNASSIPHTGKGWEDSGLLGVIEGWSPSRGSNLISNLKLSLDLQWCIHFHINSPRALKPGLLQGMEIGGEDAGSDGGCLTKTFYSLERSVPRAILSSLPLVIGAETLLGGFQDPHREGHRIQKCLPPGATYIISVLARRARGTSGTHWTLEETGEAFRTPR